MQFLMPGIDGMEVPKEFKPIQPYMQRSHELRQRDPFMAYQCELYAAQLAYGLVESTRTEGGEKFLMTILDDLEVLKTDLQEHPSMLDDHAASRYVLEFSLKVFASAVSEEQAGHINKYLYLSLTCSGKQPKCLLRRATSWKC